MRKSLHFLSFFAIFLCLQILGAQPTSDKVVNTIEDLDIEDLTQQFRDFDTNGDGYNDAGELRAAMPGITEDHLSTIFNKFDLDMDGVFTLEEYLNLYNAKLKEKQENGDPTEQGQ